MFQLARGYRDRGMAAYAELQGAELAAERQGYTATRHQREVGVGYFDAVATAISGGATSTLALEGSTETAQFTAEAAPAPAPATHAAEQVQAALDEDHGRLEGLLARVRQSQDPPALAAALDELRAMLTEHFAHEEHAKGFYGLLGTRSPEHREELNHMIMEHRELLATLRALVERAKGHGSDADLARLSGDLASKLLDHEMREGRLARELA
jgi:hemerythrin